MTNKIQYKIAFVFLFAGLQTAFAQKKEELINSVNPEWKDLGKEVELYGA